MDGIRALAIGGVFLLHLARGYFPGGAFGVDVFFVLSAYLITGNLLRELRASRRIAFGAFYWRRAFRLGPALILWVAVVATPTAVLKGASASSITWSAAGALFYFSDFLEGLTNHVAAAFDQAWSLGVEEQFYLVWPLLLALFALRLGRKSQHVVMGSLVAGSLAVAYTSGNYFLPTGHFVALSLGAWAAFYEVEASKWFSAVMSNAIVALGSFAVFTVTTFVAEHGAAGTTQIVVVDIAAAALILNCTSAPGSISERVLGSAVPRWIGQRSYGVYLYGLTLIQLVPEVTHLRLHFAAPVDVVVTALVVAVSYRYVEAPIRNRGRQWLKRRAEVRAAALVGVATAG